MTVGAPGSMSIARRSRRTGQHVIAARRSGTGRAARRLFSALALTASSLAGGLVLAVAATAPLPAAADSMIPVVANDASTQWDAGMSFGNVYGTSCDGTAGCSMNGTDATGGTNGGSVKSWLESATLTTDRGNASELRLSLLVRHDPSKPITRLWVDKNYDGTDDTGTAGTLVDLTGPTSTNVKFQVSRISVNGGAAYDMVFYRSDISGWNSTMGGTGRGGDGDDDRDFQTLRVKVGTATAMSQTYTSTIFFMQYEDSGNDWPVIWNQARMNSPTRATDNGGMSHAVTMQLTNLNGDRNNYFGGQADDSDNASNSNCDFFDSVDVRWRRVNDGTVVDPITRIHTTDDQQPNDFYGYTPSWEDNDGDSKNNYVRVDAPPDRGRWVLEIEPVNENDCNKYGGGGGNPGNDDVPNRGWWWWLATVDVNTTQVPTISSITNSGATVTAGGTLNLTANFGGSGVDPTRGDASAEATGRAQLLEWSYNGNSFGDADDVVSQASTESTGATSDLNRSLSVNTNRPPGTYTVWVRATDNGAIAPGDGMSRQATASATYTIGNGSNTNVSCAPTVVGPNQGSTCTATVTDVPASSGGGSSALGTGTVSFTTSKTPTAPATLGSCTLPAGSGTTKSCSSTFTTAAQGTWSVRGTYGGDSTHTASGPSPATTILVAGFTDTSIDCSPETINQGTGSSPNVTTCTATVSNQAVDGGGSTVPPAGSVTFTSSATSGSTGQFTPPSCTLVAAGATTSCSTSFTADGSGDFTLTGTYAPTDGHTASSGSDHVYVRNGSSITVSCSTPVINQRYAGGTFASDCMATVTDDPGATGTPAPLEDGQVTFTPVSGSGPGTGSIGECNLMPGPEHTKQCESQFLSPYADSFTVQARYDGDSTHDRSNNVATSDPILVRNVPTLTVSCTPDPFPSTGQTTCTATAVDDTTGLGTHNLRPTGEVTFRSSASGGSFDEATCGLAPTTPAFPPRSSCSVTYHSADRGEQDITAAYAGTDVHAPAEATTGVRVGNVAPEAFDQTVTASRGQATQFTLGGYDVESDALTFTITDPPGKGTLDCDGADGAECSYTAHAGQGGVDSFEFQVDDGQGGTDTATVTINISNIAPVATSATVEASHGIATPITLAGTDVNLDPLTFTAPVAGPTKGTVTCSGPTGAACTYTSAPGETGTDAFTFTADDGFGGSDIGTITVEITNTAPSAVDQSIAAVRRAATPVALDAIDANGDDLTFAITTPPTKGALDCAGPGNASCSYTSNVGETGTDSFTFRADDGFGGTDTGTVDITLVNSPPFAADQSLGAHRGQATSITLTGSDPNGDDLTFTAPVTSPSKGSLSCTGGACTYTASAGSTGTDSFTFRVDDGAGGTDTGTVSISLVNDPPTAYPQATTASVNVDTPIWLGAVDPNGDPLTYAVTSSPTKGAVTCNPSSGGCTYRSAPGATGNDAFTFTVDDGDGGTASAQVTVSLSNTAPVADPQILDAGRHQATAVTLTGSDPNGDPLTFSVATAPSKGSLSCTGPAGATCSYTSNVGATGSDAFTFTVDDGHGGTSSATVTLNLVNAAPTASGASYSVNNGATLPLTLAATDPNGDPLTYAITTPPTKGSLSCSAAACTYTPTAVSGSDTFSFVATDPLGATSAPATVTIDIVGPELAIGDVKVLEPDTGNLSVSQALTLSKPLSTDITVSYRTVDGTATAASGDYGALGTASVPKTVVMAAGTTWKALAPLVKADALTEGDETFEVRLVGVTAADGSTVPISRSAGTVTIVDKTRASSDPLIMVQDMSAMESDIPDGTNKGQFIVQFSNHVTSNVSITYSVTGGTATGGTKGVVGKDYKAPLSGTLNVTPTSALTLIVTVPFWGDTTVEPDETVELTLVLPNGAPIAVKSLTGRVTILNDD